jgi:hypothetical protein
MLPLPSTERGESIETLRSFLNVPSRNDFVLIVAWLLAALRSRGPYPLLAVSGEQGSAKTVLSKLLKALIDPNAAPVRALSREERELMIAANNGYVLERDWKRVNVKQSPPCGLITRSMKLAVMDPADRDRELIAHSASESARLSKGEVMRIRRDAARTPGTAAAARIFGGPCRAGEPVCPTHPLYLGETASGWQQEAFPQRRHRRDPRMLQLDPGQHEEDC